MATTLARRTQKDVGRSDGQPIVLEGFAAGPKVAEVTGGGASQRRDHGPGGGNAE
jgi:hypothetical protein